jgi:hypothetical protein
MNAEIFRWLFKLHAALLCGLFLTQSVDAAPRISVLGGLNLNGRVESKVFTWNPVRLNLNPFSTNVITLVGNEWSAGETVSITLFGPENSLRVIPTRLSLGNVRADANGFFNKRIRLPYDNGRTGFRAVIVRPGHYELLCEGRNSRVTAKDSLDVAPATYLGNANPAGAPIDWSRERGGRGVGVEVAGFDIPPIEFAFPHYMSVWDERPVELYATVTPASFSPTSNCLSSPSVYDAANDQPAFISTGDLAVDHFAHDLNLMLTPRQDYRWLLGTSNYYCINKDQPSRELRHIELEWETKNSGSASYTSYGNGLIGVPLWASATSGDDVYVVGRWILDAGHPGTGDRTEIHAPRLLATMRKRPSVMPLRPGDSEMLTSASQVDVYVSGHGGGANMFFPGLSAALNNGGSGGGRIRDVMTSSIAAAYYGPVGLALVGGDTARAPEFMPVNDMNYDFDVPLPPPPPAATAPQYQALTRPEHSTGVQEQVTYKRIIDGRVEVGLPNTAHIHLPYLGADNGIYARTLKFGWNAGSPLPKHYRVSIVSVLIKDTGDPGVGTGEWYLWVNVCGQWRFLTALNPQGFQNAESDSPVLLSPPLTFDVYLNQWDSMYVYTEGYEADRMNDVMGTLSTANTVFAQLALGEALSGHPDEPGQNDDIGGALWERTSAPLSNIDGLKTMSAAIVDRKSYYDVTFSITSVTAEPNPALCESLRNQIRDLRAQIVVLQEDPRANASEIKRLQGLVTNLRNTAIQNGCTL